MSYFFRFEAGMERSLALIPMLVRMKLDTCGVKLTLAQWNRLPEAERRRLLEQPCDSRDEAGAYRNSLCRLVPLYAGEEARLLPLPDTLAWNSVGEVPTQVVKRANDAHLAPPSLAQWQALGAAQRFALLKLTRDGHESPNYVPALQEFELM